METVCQPSYPLNSENASPFGTRTVYLAWPVSCAEMGLPPKTASTETASETTTITTAGILLLFIATPVVLMLIECECTPSVISPATIDLPCAIDVGANHHGVLRAFVTRGDRPCLFLVWGAPVYRRSVLHSALTAVGKSRTDGGL